MLLSKVLKRNRNVYSKSRFLVVLCVRKNTWWKITPHKKVRFWVEIYYFPQIDRSVYSEIHSQNNYLLEVTYYSTFILIMDFESLQLVVQGQAERNIKGNSKAAYLSMMKVVTKLLNHQPQLRQVTLETDDSGHAMYHTGLNIS